MGMYDDLANIMTLAILLVFSLIIVITSIGVYDAVNGDIVTYTETIDSVNTDKIVFENGDILFARNIKNFEWVLNKNYEITVEERYEHIMMPKRSKIVGVKVIEIGDDIRK